MSACSAHYATLVQKRRWGNSEGTDTGTQTRQIYTETGKKQATSGHIPMRKNHHTSRYLSLPFEKLISHLQCNAILRAPRISSSAFTSNFQNSLKKYLFSQLSLKALHGYEAMSQIPDTEFQIWNVSPYYPLQNKPVTAGLVMPTEHQIPKGQHNLTCNSYLTAHQ